MTLSAGTVIRYTDLPVTFGNFPSPCLRDPHFWYECWPLAPIVRSVVGLGRRLQPFPLWLRTMTVAVMYGVCGMLLHIQGNDTVNTVRKRIR